jgi:two-component system, LytTR family, response regulator
MGESGKIRVLVVDDEPLARSNLTVLLRLDPDVEAMRECGSGAEAIAEIRGWRPDLVFLDVQMPECDGFDVLEMLGPGMAPVVVFVTAYDQYALRAFEAGALDYLLKPFDDLRFARAWSRAKERIRGRGNGSVALGGSDLAENKILSRSDQRLVVKSAGQVLFLKPGEIDWIEAADYYVCLHVGPKGHLLRRSLAELELELDPEAFCRVHRSAMVNLARVRGLEVGKEGEYEVRLDTGAGVRLSRKYRSVLQKRLGSRK